jgi:hypothetical protein
LKTGLLMADSLIAHCPPHSIATESIIRAMDKNVLADAPR